MKKNKKLGFILLTTLIFMTLTFMLMVMVCKNGKESLFAGNRYAENEQAYLAALSGVEFIKGQLYKDKSWLTDASKITKYTSSSSDTIKISLDKNTLTGYILLDPSSKGTASSTNYDSKFEIFLENNSKNREYKSINNLANPQNIPITTNNNETVTKITNLNRREIPAKTFYAYVKGTCGKTVRYAEALLASSGTTSIDGGSIINGNIVINTTNDNDNQYTKEDPFITIQNKNGTDGKITASGLLTFKNNKISDDDIQIILNSLNKTIINSSSLEIGNFNGNNVTDENKEITSHIQYNPNPTINLNDLDIENLKISSNQNDTDENNESTDENTTASYTLPAGTYAFINDLDQQNGTNESKWVYITTDITQNDNINSILQNNMTDITDDENDRVQYIEFVKDENGTQKRTVKIKGNVISNGSLKFLVIDKNNENYEISNTNTVDMSIEENGAIQTTNDLTINGEVTGSGKINCGGNLTMNAGSSLETKAQNGIAIYAAGNINIQEAKNLSSDSKEIENTIITEAIKEAQQNVDTSNETEININGEIIPLNNAGTTNQDPNELAISFQRTKYYGYGYKNYYGIIYIDEDWFDLQEQGGDYINYKIKLKTINNQQNILIYRNDEQTPIFQRSYDELKYQMYSYYNPEESRRAGKIIVHNDMDTPHKANSSNYWYYDKGITTDKVNIKDYNRAIEPGGPGPGGPGPGGPGQNDNYMGDMKLYLDGYCVGIIDINYNKIKSDTILYNHKTIQKCDTNKKEGISFSETNYKGDILRCDCFTDFANNYEQGYNNNINIINNNNNGNNSQNTIITIQEYVEHYYKKKVANTEIKGTVYSKNGSINIEGNSGKFNLTGALIALNGNLNISNASHITLTYDPDYVPFFKNKGILTTSIFESVF